MSDIRTKKVSNPSNNIPGGGMMPAEKSKDLKKAYSKIFGYLGKFKAMIIIAMILSLAGAVLNLVGPSQLSRITDIITAGFSGTIDLKAITSIAALLALLYSLGLIFNYMQGWIMATVSQRMTQDMRSDIGEKIDRLPLKYFDSHSTGDVLSRVTNDVDTVNQSMNQSFSTLVSSLCLLIGSAAMMLITNWVMASAGILSAIAGMLIMSYIINKSQHYFLQQQIELGNVDGHIEETYGGHDVVKAYNGEASARREFHQMNETLYVCAWKSQFLSGLMQPLMIFIGNLAYVVVCIVGAILAVKGSITFGTIVAFMVYIRLFTQPLQNISQAATSVQTMAAACERVFDFLDEDEMPQERDTTGVLKDVKGDVAFSHVAFGYTDEREIIHDFSAKAHAGQKIAIVGPTGAGKTTLVNLLMRFYELKGGSINIDGVSTKSVTRENVHDQFSMVLQDTWLFEGTIRENLIYNADNISDEKLDEVCEATGITDMIRQLPKGYDTLLDDKVSFSEGQKQLLTIARAMLKDAPLLILDEATSNVDTRTELKVQRAMDKLMSGRTSFVIAHRLSTIKNADLILVLKDGDVIESGSHDELLAKGGFYADLYNSQFEKAS